MGNHIPPGQSINPSMVNGGLPDDQYHRHHHNHSNDEQRKMEKRERQKIVLWRKPLITMQYFIFELVITINEYWRRCVM